MKKIVILAVLVAALVALVSTPVQAAGVPVEVSLTLSGGGTNIASSTFANAVSRDVYSALKLKAVEYSLSGTITNAATLAVKRSASGSTYKSITVATNALSSVSFETNDWYWFTGDTPYVTCSVTNGGTVKLICEEQ